MQKAPGENSSYHAETTISSLGGAGSSEAYRIINERMHADTVIDATGDANVDFMRGRPKRKGAQE